MLLAVRIHLEVMNVTVSGDLLDSTAKQVDIINIFPILLLSFSCFPFLHFLHSSGGALYPARLVYTSVVFILVSKVIAITFDFGSKQLSQKSLRHFVIQ